MMLTDTGPIVALFDRDDRYHTECAEFLKTVTGPLVTTWPVLTECFYLLNFSSRVQDDLWAFVLRGGFKIHPLERPVQERCRELMDQYSDLPMDLADATLVALAEELHLTSVLTLDWRDFSVYRMKNRKSLKILPRVKKK